MQVVGQGNVDSVDFGIGQQLFIGSVGARMAKRVAAAWALSMEREAMATTWPVGRPGWRE